MVPDKTASSSVDEQENVTRLAAPNTEKCPQHHRKHWFIVLSVSGIVLLSAALLVYLRPGVLAYLVPDIPPVLDDDLRVLSAVPPVPDEQNAYYDLAQLGSVIDIPEEEQEAFARMVKGGTWDDTVASDLLSRNKDALALYAHAAGKQVFQMPYAFDPRRMTWATTLPPIGSWRTAAQLSSLAARSLARQGNASAAFDAALQSIRIGQNVMVSHTSLHSFLVSIALRRIGFDALRDIAASSSSQSSELSKIVEELSQSSINENALIQTLKVEYTVVANSIAAAELGDQSVLNEISGPVSTDGLPMLVDSYHFQPNKTIQMLAQHYRTLLTEARGLCDRSITIGVEEAATGTPAGIAYLMRPNAFGEYVAYESMIPSQKERLCVDMVQVAATQAVLALYAYRQDHGQYPPTLADLVPHYLMGVPIDPYDGKEFKYMPTEQTVYSSGRDMMSRMRETDTMTFHLQ